MCKVTSNVSFMKGFLDMFNDCFNLAESKVKSLISKLFFNIQNKYIITFRENMNHHWVADFPTNSKLRYDMSDASKEDTNSNSFAPERRTRRNISAKRFAQYSRKARVATSMNFVSSKSSTANTGNSS